jgi:hypothetical protein
MISLSAYAELTVFSDLFGGLHHLIQGSILQLTAAFLQRSTLVTSKINSLIP